MRFLGDRETDRGEIYENQLEQLANTSYREYGEIMPSEYKHHFRNPIRRHGATPRGHFTIIPNELARDTELSMHAYRAAIVIRTHADGYELSTASIAESQGWGRPRTRAALQELTEARWLAIRPFKTAKGQRAFEEYHVHVARKFNPEEAAAIADPVILLPGSTQTNPLAPTEPTPWPDPDQPPGLAQSTEEDHLEDQQENKQENQAPHLLQSDCWGCRELGSGCGTHGFDRALVRVGADEPDWSYSMPPEEIPPF
jgi:hypothetical protein